MKRKCICCGSLELIDNVKMLDSGEYSSPTVKLSLAKDPQAILFKETVHSTMKVSVCAECGYVHLFASSLSSLIDANSAREYNFKERGLVEYPPTNELSKCSNCNTPHRMNECPKCGFMVKK